MMRPVCARGSAEALSCLRNTIFGRHAAGTSISGKAFASSGARPFSSTPCSVTHSSSCSSTSPSASAPFAASAPPSAASASSIKMPLSLTAHGLLRGSGPRLGMPWDRENWCKKMRRYVKNRWASQRLGPSAWLCRQPYQEATIFTWPGHLNRYGLPRWARTAGCDRPDKDQAKFCNMSSVHNQDWRKRGMARPSHVENSLGPDCESGHALLRSKDIKYVRSYV